MKTFSPLRKGRTLRFSIGVLCVLGVLSGRVFLGVLSAQIDPRQMAGIPRPVNDLPNGSVSVRLIRGQLSNNIAGHPVEAHLPNGQVVTVNTDDAGRAQFDNLRAGATATFTATVDGERLESQEFPIPSQGGIRVILVATDKGATPVPPAASGQVSIGENSRIVFEPGDEVVTVYYILELVNPGNAPVDPVPAFAFDMPPGAQSTTLIEGSAPIGRTRGAHVSLGGPVPPGRTTLRVAALFPAERGTLSLTQTFPANLDRLTVLVRKVGDAKLQSAQLERQQEFPNEGETIIGGMGGRIAAGQPITLTVSDLPHHSLMPRWITLSLAGVIVAAGIWAGSRKEDGGAQEASRKRLTARREKLFGDLLKVERDRRAGREDADRLAARREELVASLEHIYGALDDVDAPASADARPSAGARAGATA